MNTEMMFSGTYEDIIQTLAKWRILDLSTLLKKVGYNYSHQAFSKRVKKLEKFGYLGSEYFQSYRKYLFLTEKGLEEAGLNGVWVVNKEIIHHDIISVNVLQYFLNLPEVNHGNIYLDRAGSDRCPDCEVGFKDNKFNLKRVALEIELTQKSYARIEKKFLDLIKNQYSFDLVIYIFQKIRTFEAYKQAMNSIDQYRDPMKHIRCQDKIMLLLEPEIKHKNFNLLESVTSFQGRITKLKDIFMALEFKS